MSPGQAVIAALIIGATLGLGGGVWWALRVIVPVQRAVWGAGFRWVRDENARLDAERDAERAEREATKRRSER